MKVVSLNTWGGRMTKGIIDFIASHDDTDIFCFQEVYHEAEGKDTIWTDGSNFNFLNDLKKATSGFTCYYRPHLSDWWGLAILVRKGVKIVNEGEHYVHKYKGHDMAIEVYGHTAKNIQFVTVENKGRPITIMNIHGLWNGKGKADTEERLQQSKKIIEFIRTIPNDYIFCGDFNLNPDSESLTMISNNLNCRDLISEYKITSTRTNLYKKEGKFADYMFVSKGVEVLDFKVLSDIISDHAPLEVTIK